MTIDVRKLLSRFAPRRKLRQAAVLAALAAVAAVLVTGCQAGYPHACDNHGGTRFVWKGLNKCHDGTVVGDGWLLLHNRQAAP